MTIVSTDAPDKFQQLRSSAGRFAERLRRFLPRRWRSDIAVVPVVRLTGTIGFSTPLRPGLTLAGIAKTLDRAFAIRRARAVALVINSPGGSAVQSHLIFRRLRELADEKQLPIIAFVEDVAASGGYMIACAADEIVCDPASIVGSIGVIGATFGFPEAMKKLGIERRVYTAGESKSMLDPFLPEKEDDVRRLATIQTDIHRMFIDLVRSRRGVRLSGPDTLFSGEYWAAATAKEFGLVDALGEVRSFLRARFGDKVAMPLIATERTLFGRRVPGISGASQHMLDGALDGAFNRTGIFEELLSAIEARSLWGRFGL
jgi:serine protease SohB